MLEPVAFLLAGLCRAASAPPVAPGEEPPAAPPYLYPDHAPAAAVWLAAWEEELDEPFLGLVAAVERVGVELRACRREGLWEGDEGRLEEAGLGGAVDWLACGEPDTVWMRDYGPYFLLGADGRALVGDARYVWGRDGDDGVPAAIAELLGVGSHDIPLRLDGGALLADGAGGCLASTQLLEPGVNTGLSPEDAEAVLAAYLGCEHVLWLEPLAGEGTGHLDLFLLLLDSETALLGRYEPEEEPENAAVLDADAELLEEAGYRVLRVPLPPPELAEDGRMLFPTPLNGLLLDGPEGRSYVLPLYHGEGRGELEEVLAGADPDLEVQAVEAAPLFERGGGLHCVTRTQPADWPLPGEEPAGCACEAGRGTPWGGAPLAASWLVLAWLGSCRRSRRGPAGAGSARQ